MKRSRMLGLALLVIPVLGLAGVAVASGVFSGARDATAPFHDVGEAIEAGYSLRLADTAGIDCIAQPGRAPWASIWSTWGSSMIPLRR